MFYKHFAVSLYGAIEELHSHTKIFDYSTCVLDLIEMMAATISYTTKA